MLDDKSLSGDDTPPDRCGDLNIRIARDGSWFYHGSPIGRKSLVKLFASVLRRDADGSYWLTTPVENGRIEVADAPFVAVDMTVAGSGVDQVLSFLTNLDEVVVADALHPIRVDYDAETGEPSPYVEVRDGLEALIGRAVYYELADRGVERMIDGARVLGVWSAGSFFPLGRLDDES